MDPRHPEFAVTKVNELKKRYDELFEKLDNVTTNQQVSDIEIEGVRITRDLTLYSGRLMEALMQKTRQTRSELGRRTSERQNALIKELLSKSESTEEPTVKENLTVEDVNETAETVDIKTEDVNKKQALDAIKYLQETTPLTEPVLAFENEEDAKDFKKELRKSVNEPVGKTDKLSGSEKPNNSKDKPEEKTEEKKEPEFTFEFGKRAKKGKNSK